MLVGPLTLTPEGGTYRFDGEVLVDALIGRRILGTVDWQPLVRARQDSEPAAPGLETPSGQLLKHVDSDGAPSILVAAVAASSLMSVETRGFRVQPAATCSR